MTTTPSPSQTLPAGKLPHGLLAELLAGLPAADPHLLLGPMVGEDAAVIDFAPDGERLLVAKSDPITFATDQIGYYAVNVCTNDLAVTGATPRFFLPTVLLPTGQTNATRAADIFNQIGAACRQLGIVVAGGHSEITPAVQQPIVAGTMLGEVSRHHVVRSSGCRPGDILLLAGAVPVEGTSLIAREMSAHLQSLGWHPDELAEAAHFLFQPGISVLQPALLAAHSGLVTAMHDPTEGGIATGLLELALAAGTGLHVFLERIPIPPLAARLCAAVGLDPLGTLASGALLATAPPEHADQLLALWRTRGWEGAVIGEVRPAVEGLTAQRDGVPVPFPLFPADEITRLWA